MLDYLEALARSTELDVVWQLHCEEMAKYGFDRLLYAYSRLGIGNCAGAHEDALVLSNHEAEYFRRYVEEGHYLHAPLLEWAMHNTGACSWSVIGQNPAGLSSKQQAVVDLNRANGVIAGYSLSLPNASPRARAITALTARPGLSQDDVDHIWLRHGREIEVKCNMAHLKIISLPHAGLGPQLSPRQLEVLEWVAVGKTNQDIATIMGLSAATVEKHLRLARRNLGVATTAQAVLKASFQNHMFVVQA